MSKFHINKNGMPSPCKAQAGNCPLGGDDTHFKTKEEAQNHIDEVNSREHGLLPKTESTINAVENAQEELSKAYDEKSKHWSAKHYKNKNNDSQEVLDENLRISEENLEIAKNNFKDKQKVLLDQNPHELENEIKMTIPQKVFDNIFFDSWNEHGYEVTGTSMRDILDKDLWEENEEKNYRILRKEIPEILKIRELGGKNDFLIKEGNLESHVRNHILTDYPEGEEFEDRKNEIIEEMKKHSPEDVTEDDKFKSGALRDDLEKHIVGKLKSESKLEINGQKIYIESDDTLTPGYINFGKDYFEGGRYEAFKKEEADRELNNPNIKIERALDAMDGILSQQGETRGLIDRLEGNVDPRLSSLTEDEINIVQSILDKRNK